VTLGGAVAIFGPKRVLDPDIGWGFSLQEQAGQSQTINAHLDALHREPPHVRAFAHRVDPNLGPRGCAAVVP
jgi:hypothetical protein